MSDIYATKEKHYGHYGYKSYRIEMDISVKHRPLQRHIWTHEDGQVDVDAWIPSGDFTEQELLAKGYSKV